MQEIPVTIILLQAEIPESAYYPGTQSRLGEKLEWKACVHVPVIVRRHAWSEGLGARTAGAGLAVAPKRMLEAAPCQQSRTAAL